MTARHILSRWERVRPLLQRGTKQAGVPASLPEGTAPAVPTSANPEVCPPNLEEAL